MRFRPERRIALATILLFLRLTARASDLKTDRLETTTLYPASTQLFFNSSLSLTPDASLSLHGAAGYIISGSSVNASAFFGDGSQLSGILRLSADQTWSGADTFTSSFTVQSNGGQISLSTSPTTTNISIDANGATSFSPSIHNSSSTTLPDYSTSATQWGPCVTGSTLTLTTAGGRVELYFLADLTSNSSLQGNPGISFIVDGVFPRDLTNQSGFTEENSTIHRSASIDYLLDTLPAGQHTFCVSLSADPSQGGTTFLSNANAASLFYATEIR